MHPRLIRTAFAGVVLSIAATGVEAQVPIQWRSAQWIGAPLDDYARLLQLSGAVPLSSRLLRPLEFDARNLTIADSGAIWRNPWRARYGVQRADTGLLSADFYYPIVRLTDNSAVPFGANDGSLWAGKGLSGAVDFGGALRYGPITLRLAPTATYSQNQSFVLGALQPRYNSNGTIGVRVPAGMSIYADPNISSDIDMPQRFGAGRLTRVDWGQSSLQINGRGFRAGISTENMWWGPGVENSLLMTNNAPGFRHVFIGTERPIDIRIGTVEAMYTVGWLHDSDFWRSGMPDSLTHRWMNAAGLVFAPRGAPGLYLGAIRAFYAYVPQGGLDLHDLTDIVQPFIKDPLRTDSNPAGDDRADQMLSLFVRWVFPESQFEVYGEFGRNDHNVNLRDAVLEPDHASAYLVGLQKIFPQSDGFLRVSAEAISLASGLTAVVRASPFWYAHYIVTQGFTQRGQIIGSAVGPAGQGQSLRFDWYRPWGSVGGFAQRQRVNDDAYFRRFIGGGGRNFHDVFLGFGARGSAMLGPVDLSASVLRQTEYNRYYIKSNDIRNVHVEVSAQVRVP